MPWGKALIGIYMNSGLAIFDPRKKSFRSAEIKRAPFVASEMVLFIINFVSRSDAAGEEGSS